jgi:hypothetical protein
MSLRTILSYFFPYERPITRFRRHIANDISNVGASKDEVTLIQRGLARNKDEARALMTKYQATHALDVIQALERPKDRKFWRRLQAVFMRIEGTTWRDPHKVRDRDEINYRVVFKKKDE